MLKRQLNLHEAEVNQGALSADVESEVQELIVGGTKMSRSRSTSNMQNLGAYLEMSGMSYELVVEATCNDNGIGGKTKFEDC